MDSGGCFRMQRRNRGVPDSFLRWFETHAEDAEVHSLWSTMFACAREFQAPPIAMYKYCRWHTTTAKTVEGLLNDSWSILWGFGRNKLKQRSVQQSKLIQIVANLEILGNTWKLKNTRSENAIGMVDLTQHRYLFWMFFDTLPAAQNQSFTKERGWKEARDTSPIPGYTRNLVVN